MQAVKTFDLRVHHRDPKTGKILRANDYVMKVSKEAGTRFERDGIEYHANGERVQAAQPVDVPPEAPAPKLNPSAPEVPPTSPEAKEPAHQHNKGHKK